MIQIRPNGGRYPARHSKYDPANVTAVIDLDAETVRIRIDDSSCLERWEEFTISCADLRALLKQANVLCDK